MTPHYHNVAGACVAFQSTGTVTGSVIAGSCWTAGLATLVEKKSRRMELAFYCLSRVRQQNLRFVAFLIRNVAFAAVN